jgi:hypothetical protein
LLNILQIGIFFENKRLKKKGVDWLPPYIWRRYPFYITIIWWCYKLQEKTVEASCFCAIKWLVAVVISRFINFNPSTISAWLDFLYSPRKPFYASDLNLRSIITYFMITSYSMFSLFRVKIIGISRKIEEM